MVDEVTVDEITPAGLPAATSADDTHIIPAMKAGLVEGLTVAQIVERARQIIIDQGDVALDTWVELVGLIRDNEDGLAALVTALALKAPLASPALTGTPSAPTAAPGTNTTQLATTAFSIDAAKINGLAAKTTPVDADEFRIADSAASFGFKVLTWADLKAAIAAVFTESYVSSAQAITAGGALTLAHGFAAVPKTIRLSLVCVTGEYGYSVDDIIDVPLGANGTNQGCSVRSDATNIYIQYGSAAQTFLIHRRNVTPGEHSSIINVNWRLVVRAYA